MQQLFGALLRMGHIVENTPGNVASTLRGSSRQALFADLTDESSRPEQAEPAYVSIPTESSPWVMADGPTTWDEPWTAQTQSWEHAHLANMNLTNARTDNHRRDGDAYSTTSTETDSDEYEEMHLPDEISDLPASQQGEAIYWAYHQAKKRWRRFSNKPTRKVRRFTRRKGGKGKGGSRSKGYLATEEAQTYFKNKGKGMRKSSGKGFGKRKGKRTNPKGPDGKTMTCSICSSENHFRAECPQSGGSSSSTFTSFASTELGRERYTNGPLADLEEIDETPYLGARCFMVRTDEAPEQENEPNLGSAEPAVPTPTGDPWHGSQQGREDPWQFGYAPPPIVEPDTTDRWAAYDWGLPQNTPYPSQGTMLNPASASGMMGQAAAAELAAAATQNAVPNSDDNVSWHSAQSPDDYWGTYTGTGMVYPPQAEAPPGGNSNIFSGMNTAGLPNWGAPSGPQEERGQRNAMRLNLARLMEGVRRPPQAQQDTGGNQGLFPQGAFGLQPGTQWWNQSAALAPQPHQPFPVVSGQPTPQMSAADMMMYYQQNRPRQVMPPPAHRVAGSGPSSVPEPPQTYWPPAEERTALWNTPSAAGQPADGNPTSRPILGNNEVHFGEHPRAVLEHELRYAVSRIRWLELQNRREQAAVTGLREHLDREVARTDNGRTLLRETQITIREAQDRAEQAELEVRQLEQEAQDSENTERRLRTEISEAHRRVMQLRMATATRQQMGADLADADANQRVYDQLRRVADQALEDAEQAQHGRREAVYDPLLPRTGEQPGSSSTDRGNARMANASPTLRRASERAQRQLLFESGLPEQVRNQLREARAANAMNPFGRRHTASDLVDPRRLAPRQIQPHNTHYAGGEYTCSICLSDLLEGDPTVRLNCHHLFHLDCWEESVRRGNTVCPNCRGPGVTLRSFNFLGPRNVDPPPLGEPEQDDISDTPPAVEEDRDDSPTLTVYAQRREDLDDWARQSSLSWSGAQTERSVEPTGVSTATYLNRTELADGRLAVLIDPGSWGNLAGQEWVRQAAKLGTKHGLSSTQNKRAKPLNVSGVGTGEQQCTYDCNVPIALQTTDRRKILGNFNTPTLEGSNLPALLGLKSLKEKRAIIDFRDSTITFCGPDDTPLQYPTGSDTLQLHHAPSGHLMLPCGEFAAEASALPEEGMALMAETATAQ